MEEGEKKLLEIYCDGASRGNPGPASIGVSIIFNKTEIAFLSEKIGKTTNNVAEWISLLKALEKCKELENKNLFIYMDSELVVKQFKGEYKTRHPDLILLKEKVFRLKPFFESIEIRHIKRELNKRADELANLALDEK
jgi:ribonuclease HI